MENTAKFNSAYAFVISEINSLLLDAGKPVASDNAELLKTVNRASLINNMLAKAVEAYTNIGDTKHLIELQESIINLKKNIKND